MGFKEKDDVLQLITRHDPYENRTSTPGKFLEYDKNIVCSSCGKPTRFYLDNYTSEDSGDWLMECVRCGYRDKDLTKKYWSDRG